MSHGVGVAAMMAHEAGCVVIEQHEARELRSVVVACTLGAQRERLLRSLDAAIEMFDDRANIDSKVVNE